MANAGTGTPITPSGGDSTTDVGKVFLLATGTPDGRPESPSQDGKLPQPLFTDAEVNTFLACENSNIRRAAALMLESIANDGSRIARVKQSGNFTESSVSMPRLLRDGAKALREEALRLEDIEGANASCEFPEIPFVESWVNNIEGVL